MPKKTLAALAALVMTVPVLAQDTGHVTTERATVTPYMSDEAIMRDALTWLDGYERFTFLKMMQLLPANDAQLVANAVRNCHRHAWDVAYANWTRVNPNTPGTDAFRTATERRTWSPWLRSNTINIERHMLDRLTTVERRQMGDLWSRLNESEKDVIREIIHNCMTQYGMVSDSGM
ncbi:MAG TPA: hypothetical protein VM328_05350 [Fimbriimonadaceae bacterium]|nr:hypothetical protein [Fimbriimonadaceae bacterium]